MNKIIVFVLVAFLVIMALNMVFTWFNNTPTTETGVDTNSKMTATACQGVIVVGVGSCNVHQGMSTKTGVDTNTKFGSGLDTMGIITLSVMLIMVYLVVIGASNSLN